MCVLSSIRRAYEIIRRRNSNDPGKAFQRKSFSVFFLLPHPSSRYKMTIQFNRFIICWHSILVLCFALWHTYFHREIQLRSNLSLLHLSLSCRFFFCGNRVCWFCQEESPSEDDHCGSEMKAVKCRSIHNGITKLNYRTEKIVFEEWKVEREANEKERSEDLLNFSLAVRGFSRGIRTFMEVHIIP